MSDNVLTWLLGNPGSGSFNNGNRANQSWFEPDIPVLRSSSQPEGKSFTFAEVKTQVKALGSGLRNAGIQNGDRLILMSSDCVEFAILMLATWAAGGIFIARGVDYTAAQQADFLRHAEPKILIVESAYMSTAAETVRLVHPRVVDIYELDQKQSRTPPILDCRSWNSLLDFTGGSSYEWPRISTKEQMECTILIEYTSGTTSNPKGVEHTHRSITNFLETLPINTTLATQQRCLSDFSWAQIGSKMLFLQSLATRTCHIVYDVPGSFSIVKYLSQVSQYRPQALALTKRTLDALVLQQEDDAKPDLCFVQFILSGTQTIPMKTRLAVINLCRGRDILIVGYGSTEGMGFARTQPGSRPSASSCVGTLGPGIHGKVVDDDGNLMESGQVGRLLFRTPMLMKGYWRDAAATSKAIDEEGFFDTGDLGFVDNETSQWHVTGRTKEIIKVSGISISPQAVEETLLRISNVGDAVVVGITTSTGEEMPVAFVVRVKEDVKEPKAEDVHSVMERKMNVYHQITGGLVWLNKSDVPYGGNGKVTRQRLKQTAQRLWNKNELQERYAPKH